MKTKNNSNKTQKTTGRPLKITPSVLAKLEDAFLYGLSDKEACLQANINPATLYRYQQENPTFCDRKEQLKHTTTIKAKKVIVQAIEK